MSFPASLTTRVVKGRFVTFPAGTPAKGTVRFILNDFMQGPTEDVFVAPFDIMIDLDSRGAFAVELPATDDPQWTPSYYKLTVSTETQFKVYGALADQVESKTLRAKLQVPANLSTPLDLADVLNVPGPVPGQSYIIAASKGVPGGVATLDSDGKVDVSQLPVEIGGPVSWLDLIDKPVTFPSDPQIVTWPDVQGKPVTFPHDEVSYADITGKPTTFPPIAHSHARSDILDLFALHVQSVPSTSWGIVHSFGREPNVAIVIDGESVMADVKYPTETTVVVNFGQPQIGKAILT